MIEAIVNIFYGFYLHCLEFYHAIWRQDAIVFPKTQIAAKIIDRRSTSLGEGAFSTVYRVKDLRSGDQYALKQMIIQSSEYKQIAINEIEAFQRFQHPSLLKLIDHHETVANGHNTIFLLLPYCSRGSLRNWLTAVIDGKIRKPALSKVLADFKQICEGLLVLHNYHPAYVHQDIKPENVLLDDDNHPLLTDFGSVRKAEVIIKTRKDILQVTEEAAQFCTASYRAPELYDPSKDMTLDTRTDVWAMGCLLFAWWFGYSPFESEFIGDHLRVTDCTALRVLAPVPQKPHPSEDDKILLEVVLWILEKDMRKRPFLEDVIHRVQETLLTTLRASSSPSAALSKPGSIGNRGNARKLARDDEAADSLV